LIQIWYQEYGGDRAYTLLGLHLLEDGSGLAHGYILDSLDGQRYAYIMHVDENGDILSSTTLPEKEDLFKVANPGQDILHISNPEGIDVMILMYDMNGCEVLQDELRIGSNELSTKHLPVGMYEYTIIQKGKVIQSGKWVKVSD
jgi:hypothetical protein